MCTTCGCGDETGTRVTALPNASRDAAVHPRAGQWHSHDGGVHSHDGAVHAHTDAEPRFHGGNPGHLHHPGLEEHAHPAAVQAGRTIDIEQRVLAKNDLLAASNRGWLKERGIRALNVMSSPGSGKTSLLVKTIEGVGRDRQVAVIEGDQETLLDAERIRATGREVVQINTGAGCHLDADMLRRGLDALDPRAGSLLFIENVGNLVCPALFDLGETAKVVVISVTEGDDKPLKYPHMFAAADLVVVNKTDLLPYVDFDVDVCASRARSLNPALEVLPLSVKTGEGMDAWLAWLNQPLAG